MAQLRATTCGRRPSSSVVWERPRKKLRRARGWEPSPTRRDTPIERRGRLLPGFEPPGSRTAELPNDTNATNGTNTAAAFTKKALPYLRDSFHSCHSAVRLSAASLPETCLSGFDQLPEHVAQNSAV